MVDNDCNGEIDESGGTYRFYPDCDLDGYGRDSGRAESCSNTPPSFAPCNGGKWTTANGDCNDNNPSVNPGHTAFETTPIAGAPAGAAFDYNCDGAQEKKYPNSSPRCVSNGRGGCDILASQGGWSGGVSPACGQQGLSCGCSAVSLQCIPTCVPLTQPCR
jgi:hypothetical protein